MPIREVQSKHSINACWIKGISYQYPAISVCVFDYKCNQQRVYFVSTLPLISWCVANKFLLREGWFLEISVLWAGDEAQLLGYLPSCRSLGALSAAGQEWGVVMLACNAGAQKVEDR